MARWFIDRSGIIMIWLYAGIARLKGDDLAYNKHVPRFFLLSGSALIFFSVFCLWATMTHLVSGERSYIYGHDISGLYIFLFFSLIPEFLYEFNIKFTKSFLLISFIEIIMLAAIGPVYILVYSVETGVGMYIAELGILFQLIGIITAVWFERLNKELMVCPHQFIHERAY